jgi:hypothetical protein
MRRSVCAAIGIATAVALLGPAAAGSGSVIFNQHMIENLERQLDLDDPTAVFRTVFEALADEVFVYPTENYYYFKFDANGRTIAGNLRLDAADRDDGVIHIGYFEYDEAGSYQDRDGRGGPLTSAEGVTVTGVDRFIYDVTAFGRTVRFRLNDRGFEAPPAGLMKAGESYVGRIQDESGLAFFLLFQEIDSHFMYVLDDASAGNRETFVDGTPRVLIGRRTGFAFFDDREHNRRILIGVNGRNTDRNNYYDGPFDQLPDNHIAESGMGSFIERAYPSLKGHIDGYGHFAGDSSGRVAISPYYVYYDAAELEFVGSCSDSTTTADAFYSCITPDFQQMMAAAPAAGEATPGDVVSESRLTGSVR